MREGPWTTADIGALLRRSREAGGFDQGEAAKALGKSVTAIWGWESGTHCPDAATLLNALEVYGFTLRVSRPRKRGPNI